jgi:hypothetical protein
MLTYADLRALIQGGAHAEGFEDLGAKYTDEWPPYHVQEAAISLSPGRHVIRWVFSQKVVQDGGGRRQQQSRRARRGEGGESRSVGGSEGGWGGGGGDVAYDARGRERQAAYTPHSRS